MSIFTLLGGKSWLIIHTEKNKEIYNKKINTNVIKRCFFRIILCSKKDCGGILMELNERIEEFYKIVGKDANLRKRLYSKNRRTENSMMHHIVNVAKKNGFNFSVDDLENFINNRCNLVCR